MANFLTTKGLYFQAAVNGKIKDTESTTEGLDGINAVVAIIKEVFALGMEHRDFSKLEIVVAKRPIPTGKEEKSWDSAFDDLPMADADEETLIGFPDITMAEYHEVYMEPIWAARQRLKTNPDDYTPEEAIRIKAEWLRRYDQTKFAKLMIPK